MDFNRILGDQVYSVKKELIAFEDYYGARYVKYLPVGHEFRIESIRIVWQGHDSFVNDPTSLMPKVKHYSISIRDLDGKKYLVHIQPSVLFSINGFEGFDNIIYPLTKKCFSLKEAVDYVIKSKIDYMISYF